MSRANGTLARRRADAAAPAAPASAGQPTSGQVLWFRVWASLAQHPKWIGLSMEQRGAWVTLGTIACQMQPQRGEFRDRAHVELLLRREGADDAASLLDGLLAGRMLDELEDGRVAFHDWSDWQRKPSDMPWATRERNARSRAKPRDGYAGEGVTDRGVTPQKRRDETALQSGSHRDDALALDARAPLDESEDGPVDLDDVRLLLDPESAVHDEDPIWVTARAQQCLDELAPTLIEAELVELQALASGAAL